MEKKTETCPVCGKRVLDIVEGLGEISIETKCSKCKSIILIELQCKQKIESGKLL